MKIYPVEFYKSFFQWRWRIKANNGKIIASSSEGFWNKSDCEHNAEITGQSLSGHFDIKVKHTVS